MNAMIDTRPGHDHTYAQRCGHNCPDVIAREQTEMRTIDDVLADQPEDDREYADVTDTQTELDGGFLIQFDDGSQIDATQTGDFGVVVGAGKLDGSGWIELNLTWAAIQVLADELNSLTRQARIDGHI